MLEDEQKTLRQPLFDKIKEDTIARFTDRGMDGLDYRTKKAAR